MPPFLPNNPWGDIQRAVGNADTWPALLRFKFWCSNFYNYRDKIDIAAFGFINGCNPNLLCRALRFCNYSADIDFFRWIHYWYTLWSRLDGHGEDARSNAYGYNLRVRRVTNLNGEWDEDAPFGRAAPVVEGFHPPANPRGPNIPRTAVDARARGYHCFMDDNGLMVDVNNFVEEDWNRNQVDVLEPGDYMHLGRDH